MEFEKLNESLSYMEALDKIIAAILGALTKNDGIDLNDIPPFVPASSPCQPGIQTSMKPSQIGKTGCFLISIMKMAEAMYGIYFDQNGIKSIYAQALKNHYIEQNCFIKNYNGVLNLMKPDLQKMGFRIKKSVKSYFASTIYKGCSKYGRSTNSIAFDSRSWSKAARPTFYH